MSTEEYQNCIRGWDDISWWKRIAKVAGLLVGLIALYFIFGTLLWAVIALIPIIVFVCIIVSMFERR